MSNDIFNEEFLLPDPDYSEVYSYETIKCILEDEKNFQIQEDLVRLFRNNRYISSKKFKFITWNTFCKKKYKGNEERTSEDVELAKQNLNLLKDFFNANLPFKVNLSVGFYKPDSCVYIFDLNKFSSSDEFQDYLDENN